MRDRPLYRDLPVEPGAPPGSAWGVFGPEDEVGTLNLATPDRAVAASSLVRTGRAFPLQVPVGFPDPPVAHRRRPAHRMLRVGFQKRGFEPGGTDDASEGHTARDDYLDDFWLQGSSQWDGLGHIRDPQHGNYNGIGDEEIGPPRNRLGTDVWARRGIVGRGVLIDVAGYRARKESPLDPFEPVPISVSELREVADAEDVQIGEGDILLLRTGWIEKLAAASMEARLAQGIVSAGLEPSEEMAEFLWDSGVAAVAADNCAVECHPAPGAPPGPPLPLHRLLIPRLGMALGECWALGDLAEACAGDSRYAFLLVSVPLLVVGAVGSPSQAMAIK